MAPRRFDALARALARRPSRRAAVLGGLAAAAAMGLGRVRPAGLAQDAYPTPPPRDASPEASPVASPATAPLASPVGSPGPLDLLAGTPVAGGEVLGRDGGACQGRHKGCPSYQDASPGSADAPLAYPAAACCSGTCRFWLAPSGKSFGQIAPPPGWYCD